MKAVVSPIYPISDKVDVSHRAGWARYWGRELDAGVLTTSSMERVGEFGRGDTLYLYHGMEWSGALNLQGGLTDEIVARGDRLLQAAKRGCEIVSLDLPMPSYGKLLADRGYVHGEALDKKLAKKQLLVPTDRPSQMIVGDSHALSQYRDGTAVAIYRTDGQTLHGVLQKDLIKHWSDYEFMTGVDLKKTDTMTFYFGNIDVRHHLLRQPDPSKAVKEMVAEYGKQLSALRVYGNVEIEVVAPLPIENESRVLPKTGWYKGTPFFGTWAERTAVRAIMNRALVTMCKKHKFDYVEHPKHFTNKTGELDFEVMEKPRSVHIRPSEYRLVQEGGKW